MPSAFSPPAVQEVSYSRTVFSNPVTLRTDADEGSSRQTFVWKTDRLGFRTLTDNKEQRVDHQGTTGVFACLHISHHWLLCVILKVVMSTLYFGCVQSPRSQMKFAPFHFYFKHLIKVFVWPGLKCQSYFQYQTSCDSYVKQRLPCLWYLVLPWSFTVPLCWW